MELLNVNTLFVSNEKLNFWLEIKLSSPIRYVCSNGDTTLNLTYGNLNCLFLKCLEDPYDDALKFLSPFFEVSHESAGICSKFLEAIIPFHDHHMTFEEIVKHSC